MKKILPRPTPANAENAKKQSADDFVSAARRLGADESKERFEAKLKKIAKARSARSDVTK
jgi:hypothetical protein